jgi:hypothetical protein
LKLKKEASEKQQTKQKQHRNDYDFNETHKFCLKNRIRSI